MFSTVFSIQVQTPDSPFAIRGSSLPTTLKSDDPTSGGTFSTEIPVQTPDSPFATRGSSLPTTLKSEDPTSGGTFSTEIPVSSRVTSVTSTNKTEDRESKSKYIEMWKLILAAVAGGLTVVFILVLSACLKAKGRIGVKNVQSVWRKTIDSSEMLPPNEDRAYCLITSVPDTDGPTGCRKSANEKQQTDDVYHMYSTIPDLPPSSFKDNVMYSSLSKL
ncbi:uncharacterized protein LOC118558419 isoform X2 [Fundulus heteroclitus]|uniref:uncharacterized protein LOC118558419 isoform X2 n=1 Tax=Fundulus heteroclitus TaxID=8078 RepID=UPI00165C8ED6|nr:uncharacterized protein LOC118558419 isoform X2 [Fundulus heteroclitus]